MSGWVGTFQHLLLPPLGNLQTIVPFFFLSWSLLLLIHNNIITITLWSAGDLDDFLNQTISRPPHARARPNCAQPCHLIHSSPESGPPVFALETSTIRNNDSRGFLSSTLHVVDCFPIQTLGPEAEARSGQRRERTGIYYMRNVGSPAVSNGRSWSWQS